MNQLHAVDSEGVVLRVGLRRLLELHNGDRGERTVAPGLPLLAAAGRGGAVAEPAALLRGLEAAAAAERGRARVVATALLLATAAEAAAALLLLLCSRTRNRRGCERRAGLGQGGMGTARGGVFVYLPRSTR